MSATDSGQWLFGTAASTAVRAAAVRTEIDRRLTEHAQLAAMTKRLAFLLNSARLVIGDKVARDTAGEAVREAEELLAKVRKT